MALSLPRPSYAAVTASLALAVAVGAGTAVAADKVTGKDLARNAVASKHIKNGTIKVKDLSAAARPTAAPPLPSGLLVFDYDKTVTIDLGNPVPIGQCLGSDTGSLTPRAGTDGTIADDQVLVTMLTPTFIGTLASGRPEGTDKVRFTVCNFSAAPRNFNGLSLRISTIDPG